MDESANGDARAVLDAIRRIVRVLRVSSRAAEKQAGLSGAQLFVLQKLAGGRRLSVNELASRTLTHQSSVSVVVQRLVDRGLVARQACPDDGRRVELSLTPQARKLSEKWPGAAQERLISAVEKMRPAPRRQLANLLMLLVEDMGIASESPGLFFEDEAGDKDPRKPNTNPVAKTAARANSPRKKGSKTKNVDA